MLLLRAGTNVHHCQCASAAAAANYIAAGEADDDDDAVRAGRPNKAKQGNSLCIRECPSLALLRRRRNTAPRFCSLTATLAFGGGDGAAVVV